MIWYYCLFPTTWSYPTLYVDKGVTRQCCYNRPLNKLNGEGRPMPLKDCYHHYVTRFAIGSTKILSLCSEVYMEAKPFLLLEQHLNIPTFELESRQKLVRDPKAFGKPSLLISRTRTSRHAYVPQQYCGIQIVGMQEFRLDLDMQSFASQLSTCDLEAHSTSEYFRKDLTKLRQCVSNTSEIALVVGKCNKLEQLQL